MTLWIKTSCKWRCTINSVLINKGCVPLGWSGSGSAIRDYSDHGRSNGPMNTLWTRIHRFIWSTKIQMIQMILIQILIWIISKERTQEETFSSCDYGKSYLGTIWKKYSLESTTTVCPALLPPLLGRNFIFTHPCNSLK